ncbi:MAG: 50S ribosomal protein L10 [Elusimicrobia bacterium]|nr:50S ribosomal protein L10 [Elusimicrobiota bacterium]
MQLTKQAKKEQSSKMAQEVRSCSQFFFTHYHGLKFQDMAELRKRLKAFRGEYRIVKNSLVRHALKEAGIPLQEEDVLRGPVGMVLGKNGDATGIAKVLQTFSKEFPALKVRAGYAFDRWMGPEDCRNLSNLQSRPELLQRLAGVLYTTLSQIASVLEAPLRDFLLAVRALQDKNKHRET